MAGTGYGPLWWGCSHRWLVAHAVTHQKIHKGAQDFKALILEPVHGRFCWIGVNKYTMKEFKSEIWWLYRFSAYVGWWWRDVRGRYHHLTDTKYPMPLWLCETRECQHEDFKRFYHFWTQKTIHEVIIPDSLNSLSSVTIGIVDEEQDVIGAWTWSSSHHHAEQETENKNDDSVITVTDGHHIKKLPISKGEQIRYRCNWCYHFCSDIQNARSSYYCEDCCYAFCMPSGKYHHNCWKKYVEFFEDLAARNLRLQNNGWCGLV